MIVSSIQLEEWWKIIQWYTIGLENQVHLEQGGR